MRYAVIGARILLGAWMLFNGLNWFVLFVPQPTGIKSEYLHLAFMQSGLFTGAKLTETVVGASLLANRFVPVSLVIGFPVTVIIAYMALFIEDPRPAGVILFIVHALLLLAYIKYYVPMLAFKAKAHFEPDAKSSAPALSNL